jgi:hypothetical protein
LYDGQIYLFSKIKPLKLLSLTWWDEEIVSPQDITCKEAVATIS